MPLRRKLKTWVDQALDIPPGRTMVYLFMAGSALLFSALLFSHAALTRFHFFEGSYSKLPRAFVLSTLVLAGSTFLLRNLKRHFRIGQLRGLVRHLTWVCIGGFVFAGLQVWGGIQLYRLNFSEPGLSREWVLVGIVAALHLLHLVGGLAALVYQTLYFRTKTQDPADEVILLADPYYYGRIRTLSLFWYYTDFIWLVLFLYFLAAL